MSDRPFKEIINEFYATYERYKHRYHLICHVQTNIYGENRIRIWQQISISDERLILDVTAEESKDMYSIATSQLQRYFEIFYDVKR